MMRFSNEDHIHFLIEKEDSSLFAENTRTYYNSHWMNWDEVTRFIENVCTLHGRQDSVMESLCDAKNLLNFDERLRSRKKVLCVRGKVYASGGCGPFKRILLDEKDRREILILFCPTIDWDLSNLDADKYFILHEERDSVKLSKITQKALLYDLGGGFRFDEWSYSCSIAEDFLLYFMAAEEEQIRQGREKKLWIKVPPLGIGNGVYTWNNIHIGPLLIRPFYNGVYRALTTLLWTKIGVIDIVDISRYFSMTPMWPSSINGVRIEMRSGQDILDFSNCSDSFDACVICPGDAFAWPGNEFKDSCLNSMIGNNTSLRRMGSPLHNPYVLDKNTIVPVKIPHKFAVWWPPRLSEAR